MGTPASGRTQIDDRDAPERDQQEECHLHDLRGRQEEGRRQEDHPKEDRHGPPGETADTSSSMGTKRERKKNREQVSDATLSPFLSRPKGGVGYKKFEGRPLYL